MRDIFENQNQKEETYIEKVLLHEEEQKPKKKKGNKVLRAIGIILICIGIAVAGYYFYRSAKNTAVYDGIYEQTVTEETDEFTVDVDALYDLNNDFVAWLHIPDYIDYPVCQGESNSDYIHTNFYGEYSYAGCIYMSYKNSSDFSDANTLIYGHNMRDGSMFAGINAMRFESVAEEHPYIYIYTVDHRLLTYEVFSVRVVETGSDDYNIPSGKKAVNQFLSAITSNMEFDLGKTDLVDSDSKVLTLSTCRGQGLTNYRVAVHAVLVNEGTFE